jgi:hypothetical protein
MEAGACKHSESISESIPPTTLPPSLPPPPPPPPPPPAIPSLARLALRSLLLCSYDDESRVIIEDVLVSALPIERVCALLAEPAVFTALAGMPRLTDACRAHLAARSKTGRRLLDELVARYRSESGRFGEPAAVEGALATWTVCERLLCAGMFKRDIRGAQLPTELANLVRALRKACHRVVPAQDGIGHWRPAESDVSRWRTAPRLALLARAQALGLSSPQVPDSATLKRLDQFTG